MRESVGVSVSDILSFQLGLLMKNISVYSCRAPTSVVGTIATVNEVRLDLRLRLQRARSAGFKCTDNVLDLRKKRLQTGSVQKVACDLQRNQVTEKGLNANLYLQLVDLDLYSSDGAGLKYIMLSSSAMLHGLRAIL